MFFKTSSSLIDQSIMQDIFHKSILATDRKIYLEKRKATIKERTLKFLSHSNLGQVICKLKSTGYLYAPSFFESFLDWYP